MPYRRAHRIILNYTITMSRRWRVALAVVGLLLVCLSVAALAYAVMPVDRTREQYRPEPTLFAPPQSKILGEPIAQEGPTPNWTVYWQEARV